LVEMLKKSRQFQEVYRQGNSRVSSFLVVYWLENESGYNRYGFSLSKKVGKAVVRNRLRRQLKELIRRWLDPCLKQGFDVIIIARPYLVRLDFWGMKADLTELLRQTSLLKTPEVPEKPLK